MYSSSVLSRAYVHFGVERGEEKAGWGDAAFLHDMCDGRNAENAIEKCKDGERRTLRMHTSHENVRGLL
jgi:hypothetical protein